MDQKPKPRRGSLPASYQMTPLLHKSDTVRDTKHRIIFASPRQVPLRAVKLPEPMHAPVGKPQISRKMSLPTFKPSDAHTIRVRTRAGSDPRATTKLLKEIAVTPAAPPALSMPTIGKCFSLSQVGTVCGRAKPNNQDSHFYVHVTLQNAEYSFLGVCDGHGQAGHFVSGFVSSNLPAQVRGNYLKKAGNSDFWSGVLLDSFAQCNSELKNQGFDSTYSGCTAVVIVVSAGQLVCANVGDSRAVLARRTGTSLTALSLSRDQKPDVPEERQRIIDFGGRVEAFMDEDGLPVGPPRVWLKNEDVPGLAMSRAMGDSIASRVGVTSIPGDVQTELFSTFLTPEDAFIVIASDGIWEFMSSQEVVNMVESCVQSGHPEDCCRQLVEEAAKRWRREEDCVDDITVLVAFLETR